MKRCSKCRRDYFDDSLLYCLDDGERLMEGPTSFDEPQTAITHETAQTAKALTGGQINTTEQTAVLPIGITDLPKARSFERRLLLASLAFPLFIFGGFFGYRYFAPSGGGQINSVAVLPFTNDGGNQELEYIADGLPETLIYRLSQIPQLKVSPRSSVFRYKGKELDAETVGSQLGVDAVMSGRVIQRGDNLTISVDLVDVRNKKTLWGEQFERRMSDLLATQREIAAKIMESLRLKLSGNEQQAAAKQYTTSSEAYQLYLKGRYHFGKRADTEIRAAMENFKQAIAADPNFALAYTGLADCYSLLPIYDRSGTARAIDTMPLAKEAVLKSISIDDAVPEAHASLGLIYDIFDWNTTAAEKEYRRAIELNPNYAASHQWYAEMLCNLGRFDEGLAESRRAIEVEPFSLPANFAYGLNLYKARRYDEAIAQFNRLFELAPDYTDANHFLYEAYSAKGDYANAVKSYITQRRLDGEPKNEMDTLQAAFDRGGWDAFLKERIRFYESREAVATGVKLDANEVGCMYARSGNNDKAIEWLQRAYEQKDEGLTWLLVAPRYDPLRGDPRFQAFVNKVGFAD